ncbi:MAG: hypothetical protein QGD93_10830 [Actinomycetota bacterium]|nr:hypothetical protein [Actinomycetota bacterium]
MRRENAMVKTDAITYLDIGAAEKMTDAEIDLCIVRHASENGYYMDLLQELVAETALINAGWVDGVEPVGYDGDLAGDLSIVADDAIAYLNDTGLLPGGYGFDDTRAGDGWGDERDEGDDGARRGGAGQTDGAARARATVGGRVG